MKRPAVLLLLGLLATTFLGCSRRSETITAFGESNGRSVPGMVQYYDRAATALEKHLTSLEFSATTQPVAYNGWGGTSYVAQKDTWYRSNFRGPTLSVKIRQPTENAAGINVYVCFQASSSASYGEVLARAFCERLSKWWECYEQENPRPDAKK